MMVGKTLDKESRAKHMASVALRKLLWKLGVKSANSIDVSVGLMIDDLERMNYEAQKNFGQPDQMMVSPQALADLQNMLKKKP